MVFVKKTYKQKVVENLHSIIVIAVLASIPFTGVGGYWLDVLTRVNIFLLIALALDIYSGTTYYLNLGISFTVGLSAYLLAILNINLGVPTELSIPLSALLSTLFSLLIFLPSLKVKGVYFAITSLLTPIIFAGIVTTQPFSLYLGGEGGLRPAQLLLSYARTLPPGVRLQFLQLSYYYLTLLIALVIFTITYKIAYSDFGFMLRAIGQDEVLAEVAGINTLKVKTLGFLYSSFIAALAGSLYGALRPPVTVDLLIPANTLMPALTAVIVGGLGSIVGSAIATYILLLVYEVLWGFIGRWRVIAYMALLIIMVLIKPQGVLFPLYIKVRKLIRRWGQ